MVSVQIHKEHIKEHVQVIGEAIAVGIEKRSATIGLHASACSISLLELYLHILGKISTGIMIKHEWFKPPKPEQKIDPIAERRLGVDFPDKNEILSLMYSIEDQRNKLIYGKSLNSATESVLSSFQKLHQVIKEKLKDLGEEIE